MSEVCSVDWVVDEVVRHTGWHSSGKLLTMAEASCPIAVTLGADKVEFTILREMHGFSISIDQLERMVEVAKSWRNAPPPVRLVCTPTETYTERL